MIAHTLKHGESQPVEEKPIHLTVDRSKKVEAPDFARPDNRFFTRHELEEKLHQSRQRLRQITEQANPADLEAKSFPHPIFGPLNLKQWVDLSATMNSATSRKLKKSRHSFREEREAHQGKSRATTSQIPALLGLQRFSIFM